MKTSFNVCALVSSLLVSRGYTVSAVEQASESFLNSLTVKGESWERSALKLKKSSGNMSETGKVEYLIADSRNNTAQFIAWNDKIANLAKKNADNNIVGGTLADFPPAIDSWLASCQGFKAKAPEAPQTPAKAKKPAKSEQEPA